jgi:hypothetical protein
MDWLASLFISSGVSFTPGAVATKTVVAPSQIFTLQQCEKKVWK